MVAKQEVSDLVQEVTEIVSKIGELKCKGGGHVM